MIRYVGPAQASELVLSAYPEIVLGEGRVDAWLLGSGVSANAASQIEHVRHAVLDDRPKVIDAGALTVIDWDAVAPGTCILTPHAGELARLLDSFSKHVELDYEAVGLAAAITQQVVLLKGNTTLIASPSGKVVSVGPNPTVLATAGTGDVLAGILGALLASNSGASTSQAEHAELSLFDLTAIAELGVEIHSEAGRRASSEGTVVAHDLIPQVAKVVSEWQS
jgi:hydroxyethylthiazole kinase-like uncharacterized protein yjeF